MQRYRCIRVTVKERGLCGALTARSREAGKSPSRQIDFGRYEVLGIYRGLSTIYKGTNSPDESDIVLYHFFSYHILPSISPIESSLAG